MSQGHARAVEVLDATCHHLGEGPRWDPRTEELVWVDILTGRLFRGAWLDGGLGPISTTTIDRSLGFALPRTAGGFAVGAGTGFGVLVDTLDMVAEPEAGKMPPMRMNDGAVDPAGRVFGGSMGFEEEPGVGTLYRLDGEVAVGVQSGMTIPNGLGWSPDGARMYVTDSSVGIQVHDYDVATGELGPPRPWVRLAPGTGVPDGLAVDSEGHVWSAIWGGAAIHRYDPEGVLVESVPVPVSQPSACCFAGRDLDLLVVTSATKGLGKRGELDGCLLVLDPGVAGLPVSLTLG